MLDHASAGIGLNHSDWRQVTRRHADFDALELAPRFYLFTVKALGYLHVRAGRLGEGRAMLEKVAELDPADRIGSRPSWRSSTGASTTARVTNHDVP